jgi:two-component system, NarL family, sensor histidine kinase UhpB
MHLLLHLVGRVVVVAAVCLTAAVAWVMIDARRTIDADAAATAERVGQRLESLYWQKLMWRDGMSRLDFPIPDWQTPTIASVISPGNCVTFDPPGEAPQRLCSQIEAVGPPAPPLFAAAFDVLFGPPTPVRRSLMVRSWNSGFIVVAAEPEAALRLAWRQVSVVIGFAAAMAAAIAALAAMTIGHALIPARAIIEGLRRLQQGDLGWRLPGFRTAEFNLIARAVNDLSAALARTDAARVALTGRLFQVQEEERRALARDLHDEFGQCLTATAALAASIEAGAPAERADLADDARAIARIQRRMMENLRSALVRLRSQDVEEIGLEASLQQLIRDHNQRGTPGAVFRLNVIGKLAALPQQVAIDVYRIAQECLTNAVRHGSPTEVKLSVACPGAGDGTIAVTVEDDGGGDAACVDPSQGHGLLGIQERVAARGGNLSIGRAARGLRLSAKIPVMRPDPALSEVPA